ncbi:hypothetical protein E2C01_084626 [Portunus trituberculatus]|uniref:Uncharacterized protein n=1 Tax=Portunus trituberculatus TaxID=210409 RepID=A0A5B7J0I1_PORTR|nr:hypothetical protein [Portunus trituberculatus]
MPTLGSEGSPSARVRILSTVRVQRFWPFPCVDIRSML